MELPGDEFHPSDEISHLSLGCQRSINIKYGSPSLFHDELLKKGLFYLLFYFLPVVGLCCCACAFSSCGEGELLFICGPCASHCGGFSREAQAVCIWASVVVVHGLSCPMAYGILSDQRLNRCPLHCKMDS